MASCEIQRKKNYKFNRLHHPFIKFMHLIDVDNISQSNGDKISIPNHSFVKQTVPICLHLLNHHQQSMIFKSFEWKFSDLNSASKQCIHLWNAGIAIGMNRSSGLPVIFFLQKFAIPTAKRPVFCRSPSLDVKSNLQSN